MKNAKKLTALLLAAALAAGFSGCAPKQEPSQPDGTFVFTQDNYPRMGGSLAALPLGEAVTASVLGIDRESAGQLIVFEGSTTDNYKALVDGTFDILLAYEPSQEAKEYAEEQGFEWEMTPVGRDALVFITGEDNPIDSLSTEQIKDIYRGKLKSWSEVGGSQSEIIPYQRNKDSGSQTLFDKLIDLGDELMDAPTDKVIGSMIGLLEVVADYENSKDALGYTVYYYLTNMETDKLSRSKILSVDGVAPSNETIASKEYPYTNDFYVVIPKGKAQDDPVYILYDWIRSAQGLELVEREGYVPVK
ncbi:substrate-binding domain-containing protein [Feifania hominis]|uniref:Substrate-binding domain-containing protein n=1 Tax=Feifania hominis TaxID=2763660 RepID=A0A926HUM1_9FIRM|nr:substrate-binding domain-containing protein [Feifania hominis]MBC8536090.1 substrate-binding domain-containing protein [Feifania hominis]